MLRSLNELKGYRLRATDGELGEVRDFTFDDQLWTIRYLVADTARWLPGRSVLISASALGDPSWEERSIPVALSKDQVKNAPDVDSDRPISRQKEIELARHYRWPEWWGVGAPAVPPAPPELREERPAPIAVEAPGDPHLRSLGEVIGYAVDASGERIGKVKDLIAHTNGWVVRYFVVDVRLWRPGGEVLLAPAWIERIDWAESSLVTDMTAEALRGCPPYTPSNGVNREYEEKLYDYVGRRKYWL